MVNVIRVQLPSRTPFVGSEIFPYVLWRSADNTTSSDDIHESSPVEGHFLRYIWYRIENAYKNPVCSIHPTEKATTQCIFCGKAKLPVATSYHCSTKCFMDAWPYHRALHERAAEAAKEMDREAAGESSNATARVNIGTSSSASQSTATPSHPVTHRKGDEIWLEVGYSKTYVPTTADISSCLGFECLVTDAQTKRCVERLNTIVMSRVIPAPTPTPRRLIPVNLDKNVHVSSTGIFTVLSYNVLADSCATGELYSYCPSWALSWPYRSQNLLREIVDYRADIVCLQEVQNNHFEEFFAPELEKHGYNALYLRKSTEVSNQGTVTIDGCATFFRRDKFSHIRQYDVEFNKAAKAFADTLIANVLKNIALSRLAKDNVALTAILETKFSNRTYDAHGKGQLVCVANTHVNVPQELMDVKIWQVHSLVKGLEKVVGSVGIPIILCGDFSSVPGSALHSLLVTRKVDPLHPDLAVDPLGVLQPATKLTHNTSLASAYSSLARIEADLGYNRKRRMNPATSEPMFTHWTRNFIGTFDYIFYTEDSLIVESLLEPPHEDSLKKDTALPSPKWSSDHIALLAGFRCKPI